jgi:hypothetical protein
MSRARFPGISAVAGLFVLSAALAAGGTDMRPPGRPGPAGAGQAPPAAARQAGGTILGSVWNEKNEGVAGARVRLRSLSTGQLRGTVRADAGGQFTLAGLAGDSYVLECVNEQGHVLAVGHTFTLLPNETLAAFLRLGLRRSSFADFFQNAAASAISAAASLGVTAVAPAGQPTSPER